MTDQVKSLQKAQRGGGDSRALAAPTLEHQHLWFRLTSVRRGGSVALVPAEPDLDTLPFAEQMAQVASQQPEARVLVVNASLRKCLPPREQPTRGQVLVDGLRAAAWESLRPGY